MTARKIIVLDKYPVPLVSANAIRGQTRYTSKKLVPWREFGVLVGRQARARFGTLPRPVRVWAEFRFPTNARRDTANYYPTIKALVDGLVTANLLDDDRDGYIEGPLLIRSYPNGPERLRLIFESVPVEQLGKMFSEEHNVS